MKKMTFSEYSKENKWGFIFLVYIPQSLFALALLGLLDLSDYSTLFSLYWTVSCVYFLGSLVDMKGL